MAGSCHHTPLVVNKFLLLDIIAGRQDSRKHLRFKNIASFENSFLHSATSSACTVQCRNSWKRKYCHFLLYVLAMCIVTLDFVQRGLPEDWLRVVL